MEEGSYLEMEPGMPVIDARGEKIGHVQEVLADEASGIFHGLAVDDASLLGGTTWYVPGEAVQRLHDGVITITAVRDELSEYTPPSHPIIRA
jgi:sporulation protein YlmC with PRC-barrel domain